MREKKTSTYFPSLQALRSYHRGLYENKETVISFKQSEIAYSSKNCSMLTIVARFPYKATKVDIQKGLYKCHCFLRDTVPSLSKEDVLDYQSANLALFSKRGYKVFYGFETQLILNNYLNTKENKTRSFKPLNFETLKNRFDYDLDSDTINNLLKEELISSDVTVAEVINLIYQSSVLVDSDTKINQSWERNRLMKLIVNSDVEEKEDGVYSIKTTGPRENHY